MRPAATPDTTAIGRALTAIGGYDALRHSMPLRPLPGSADELLADHRLAVDLEARGLIRSATAVTIAAWQAGGRVIDRAPSHSAPSRRPRGQPETAEATARYFAEHAKAQADDPIESPLRAHALRICPDDADGKDFLVLLEALASGASDAAALVTMRQKRATPPWAGARPC